MLTASINEPSFPPNDAKIAAYTPQKTVAILPLKGHVAAVSCGLYQGTPVLDLDYAEDSSADADANFVLTDQGAIIEIQGTAEKAPFVEADFAAMLELAKAGIAELVALQKLAAAAA